MGGVAVECLGEALVGFVTDLNWIFTSGFLGMRFYDMPSFLLCVSFVFLVGRWLRVPAIYQGILLLHCALPLFLNGVLFSYSYMPDAFKYWRQFNAIRGGELSILEAWGAGTVERAALFFSAMPFPLAVTPLSLGFFNSFLYAALFFWLFKKRVFTPLSLWFFLLYPSLALYTGMGLRDTFILVFMVVAVQSAREGQILSVLVALFLLFSIKFQNAAVLLAVLLPYMFFGIRHSGVSLKNGVVLFFAGILGLVVLSPVLLPLVNGFRLAMFVEDGGEADQLTLIGGPGEFVVEGLTSGVYFLLKPFLWEAAGLLQLIQAAENLVVFGLLVLIVRAAWRRVPKKLIFWLLFMAFALSIYGLVVFNYGTAARYRYPFIVIFVLFVCADCHVRSVFKPFAPAHWRLGRRRESLLGGKKRTLHSEKAQP